MPVTYKGVTLIAGTASIFCNDEVIVEDQVG